VHGQNIRHLIGQQLIIGIEGLTLSQDEAHFIVDNNIGGIILFRRNVESPSQLRELCLSIQSLRHQMPNQAPLFISIDMEGGRVHRLRSPFTQWPALACLGKIGSTETAYEFALAMGTELRAVGINLDFAPSVDVFNNPKNTVIGDRALGTDAELVARLAPALVQGYYKANVIPCAKHFPGHGHTVIDSHEDLPIEMKTLEELERIEFEPFRSVFRTELDLLMSAHIKFPNIDPDWPGTLSEIFMKRILRDQLGYRGLVTTDDLDMKGLTRYFDKATIAVRALQAGANILLYCNEPESPVIAMDAIEKAIADKKLNAEDVVINHKRILELKVKALAASATGSLDPLSQSEMGQIIGCSKHLNLAQSILKPK
jgi:beta-N-acetylhexosaminidase